MIKIRKAVGADQAAVFGLLKGLGSSQTPGESRLQSPAAVETFRRIVADAILGSVLVAEEDGTPVGVITLSYPVSIRCGGKYTCIEEFIVSEGMRGKGVGSGLLSAAIAEAQRQGCFEVQVNNPSELGYPLYIRANMKDTGKHLKMKL